MVSPGLGGPCAQHPRSQACGRQGSDSHSQLRAGGRADGDHVVPAVLLRWLQPRRRGGEGPMSLWAASLGWGVGCMAGPAQGWGSHRPGVGST